MFWIIFWSLFAFVPEYRCQEVAFFRCNNDTKIFEFVYAEQNVPALYDIYAMSKRSSCGLLSGAFTGTGVFSNPYTLAIDLSSGLAAQDPDCGVTQGADDVINLEMVTQMQCEVLTANDNRYAPSCSMTIPRSSVGKKTASYTCVSPSTIVFNFRKTDSNGDSPSDIYVMDHRASCSKSSGSGLGEGTTNDPFSMRIDVETMATQCGVQRQSQEVYTVLIYVQMLPSILTSDDVLYRVTCDFSLSSSIGIETLVIPADNNPPVVNVNQSQPRASLNVVTASGDALTSLTVGNSIRLVAQLLDGPAVGLRVTSCQASPGPGETPILIVLDSKGCSTTPLLVPPFVGQAPTGSVAMTNEFKAFKFDQSDSVYFSCQATICYRSDLSCFGSHCDGSSRRKRDANRDNTSQKLGVLIVVREPNAGNSSDVFQSSKIRTSHDVKVINQWPVAAVVATSSLGTAFFALFLLTIVLLTRRRLQNKPQNQEISTRTLQDKIKS